MRQRGFWKGMGFYLLLGGPLLGVEPKFPPIPADGFQPVPAYKNLEERGTGGWKGDGRILKAPAVAPRLLIHYPCSAKDFNEICGEPPWVGFIPAQLMEGDIVIERARAVDPEGWILFQVEKGCRVRVLAKNSYFAKIALF